MNLKRRIEKLERPAAHMADLPSAIVVEFYQPSATGPELSGLLLQPLKGAASEQFNREPGECEADFRNRFEALYAQ